MIIVLKQNAGDKEISEIANLLSSLGLGAHVSKGTQKTIIGAIGDESILKEVPLELMDCVEKIIPIVESYKLASRSFKPENSVVDVGGVKIGGKELVLMAGPCAVESEEQVIETAKEVKKSGAKILRGGAYKPRTSPYSFQGLEEQGLIILNEARQVTGLKVICEVTSERHVEIAAQYIDILQIGARNSQNFQLLREVGRSKMPVMLKRGHAMTIEELLDAAEYIMSEGNYNVILCERGIRTFETLTRNTLDISSVPIIKELSHLPVIVDPSHAGGKAKYVAPLSRAAIAAGADGLIIEVHPEPKKALSDAKQQITPAEFDILCKEIAKIAPVVEREFLSL